MRANEGGNRWLKTTSGKGQNKEDYNIERRTRTRKSARLTDQDEEIVKESLDNKPIGRKEFDDSFTGKKDLTKGNIRGEGDDSTGWEQDWSVVGGLGVG